MVKTDLQQNGSGKYQVMRLAHEQNGTRQHAEPKTREHSHEKEKQGGREGHTQNVRSLLTARIIISRARQCKNLGSDCAVWSRGILIPEEGEGV